MSAMPTAVLFDLDNTLIDRERAFRECVFERFAEAGVRSRMLRLDAGGFGDRQLLLDAWRRYSGEVLDPNSLGRRIAGKLKPDAQLLAALGEFSRRAKLGIITNGGSESQRAKWRAAGLDQVIAPQRLWMSAEVGLAKPEPALFLLAARSLGERPGDCLFIGDQLEYDIAGAAAAGMESRLVSSAVDAEFIFTLANEACV